MSLRIAVKTLTIQKPGNEIESIKDARLKAAQSAENLASTYSSPARQLTPIHVERARILQRESLGNAVRLTSADIDFRRPANLPDVQETEAQRLSRMVKPFNPAFGGLSNKTPLFVQGAKDGNSVDMNDVNQGNIGDCYVMAPLAALAQSDPEAIKRMIRDNGDGTYTVTFKERLLGLGPSGLPEYVDKKITVTADFPGGLKGKGHAELGDANIIGNKEIWPLIIEKAYAEYKGGYDKIANGGNPAEVMEALTGRPALRTPPGFLGGADGGFSEIKREFESGKLVVFSSPPYPGSYFDFNEPSGSSLGYDMVNKHGYTVTKMYTDENGRNWVELYNPWGSSHPKPVPYDELKNGTVSIC